MRLDQTRTHHRDTDRHAAHARQAVADIGRALTLHEVAQAILDRGMAATDAIGGAVLLMNEDRTRLQPVRTAGHAPGTDDDLWTKTVRARRPTWSVVHDKVWTGFPLLVEGVALGAVGWTFPSSDAWESADREFLMDLAAMGAAAAYRACLYEAERKARMAAEADRNRLAHIVASLDVEHHRAELLARASDALEATLEPAEALPHIARMAVPLLGEWCAIEVVDEHGHSRRVASAHVNPRVEAGLRRLDEADSGSSTLTHALRRGHHFLLNGVTEDLASSLGLPRLYLRRLLRSGLTSILVVPLRVHERTLGALSIASKPENQPFRRADVALAEDLARRIATVLEHARLYALAQAAVRARDEFLAATSHELRTPLSHIKGFVSTLRKPDLEFDAETHDDFLAEIELEADRLTQLVDDLLDLARIDSGGIERGPPRPLIACINGGLNRVRGSIGEHQLEVQVPDDLPAVPVDVAQIERVIANLVDNAAKYSPPTSPIRIKARLSSATITVRVEDRGLGIPVEHAERIFEPFFREPAGGFPAKRGAGLGLSICRGIVHAHGGRIWAENREGGGATLAFTLPIQAAADKV